MRLADGAAAFAAESPPPRVRRQGTHARREALARAALAAQAATNAVTMGPPR